MARKLLWILAILFVCSFSASPVLACHKNTFGPKYLKIKRWHCHISAHRFTADKSGEGTLIITKKNRHKKIRRGYVCLNGRFYSLNRFLRKGHRTMEKSVKLRRRNYLFVYLFGARCACLQVEVRKKHVPVNQPPIAEGQTIVTNEDTPTSILLTGADSNGDPLHFEVLSEPEKGTLSGTAPDLTYTPHPDANGPDSFTFKVNDGTVDSSPGTVDIDIIPVNDPPVAHAASDKVFCYVGDDVLLYGSGSEDVDGDVLTFLWAFSSCPAKSDPELIGASEAEASFVPYAPGLYHLELTVTDIHEERSTATVEVGVSFAPFAVSEPERLTHGGAGHGFGAAVAVRGNRVMVGAPKKGLASGAAYIFEHNSPWSEPATLTSQKGNAGDRFGASVSVTEDRAIVGASGDDDQAGSAYVYLWDDDVQSWMDEQRLTAGDGKEGDEFGASVSIQGDLAAVGAPGDDVGEELWDKSHFTPEDLAGYCPDYMLQCSWWLDGHVESMTPLAVLETKGVWVTGFRPAAVRLMSNYAGPIDSLEVIDESGETIGSSAPYNFGEPVKLMWEPGSSYDIRRIQASHTKTFWITNIEFLPPGGDEGLVDAGSAYAFRRDGAAWIEEAQLTAGDGEEGDRFGVSVSLSNDRVIVGADLDDDDPFVDSGSAYVFIYKDTAWIEQAKLVAKESGDDHHFGASVAVDGDLAVVGAPGTGDVASGYEGAAYVFTFDGQSWAQEAKLRAGDGAAGDCFGASVCLSGKYLVVGAPNAAGDSGAAYVFRRDGSSWTEEGKIIAGDAEAGKLFGASVAMSGDQVIAGAPGDIEKGDQPGAAYVYTMESYHTVIFTAEPEVIFEEDSSILYWTAVNALTAEIEPDLGIADMPLSGSAEVSPEETTLYTITSTGRYGMDTATVTVTVTEP